jgi:type II secretory pathway predicted ATPase ExeA/septal ring-binding cell division protein DamX
MYLDHYGLTEPPFRITPHTDFFFSGANRGATLEALIYAITHDEGIVKISGEVGSGKTMLCRVLMERLPDNVVIIYLANPSLSRDDILYALADELGLSISAGGRANAVLKSLQDKLVSLYGEGKQVVVLIDEAHAMPRETLEEIRLLSNLESNRHKLLQLVMFGQPELNETLSRPDMRQLRERITHNFGLEPLVRDDVSQYIEFRMRAAGYRGPSVFTPTAIKLIADTSLGLTRRINILADKALLASFAAGLHQVGPKEVKAAIRDSEFGGHQVQSRRTASLPAAAFWGGIGALGMLIAIGLWQGIPAPLVQPHPSLPTSAPPAGGPATETEAQKAAPGPLAPAPVPQASGYEMQSDHATRTDESSAHTQAPTPPPQGAVASTEASAHAKATSGNPTKTPLLAATLSASHSWLETVPANSWFIQLSVIPANQSPKAEQLLQHLTIAGLNMSEVRAYYSKLSGTARFGIIFGEFSSRKAAENAIAQLPSKILDLRPYPRQAIRLR